MLNMLAVVDRIDMDAEGDCWIWKGHTHKGYARFNGRQAHRVLFEAFIGPIPDGLELDHLCRNPLCVNPHHVEPVTRAENMRRRSEAQTHCKRGHEFTEANTYLRGGRRTCRRCQVATVRRYRLRRAS